MKKVFVFAVVVLAMAVSAVYAQQDTSVPPLINYQGRLTDAEGKGLAGTRKIEFSIYDAATGGTKIWGPQIFNSVPLINGMFNVILGSTDTAGRLITDAFSAKDRYIGVTVEGKAILPRQQVLSTPFAVQAEQAARATDAEHAAKADVASKAETVGKWTPVSKTLVGDIPLNPLGTKSYNIPDIIPSNVNELLIYALIATGTSCNNCTAEVRIYTSEGNNEYSHYLFAFGWRSPHGRIIQ